MNKKFLITYTIFASFVFAFSIFFFSFNIYKEYQNGLSKSGQTYYNIGIKIFDASKINQNTIYEETKKIFEETIELTSIQVTTEKSIIISLPDENSILNKSKFIKNFQTELTTPSGIINISANILLLQPYYISYYAKFSTLIVLIITLITIILIIYLYSSDKKNKSIQNETENINESTQLNDNNSYSENDQSEFLDNSETIQDESIQLNNQKTSETLSLPYEELKPLHISSSPTGLFNPTSGIGWESYLKPRLESEINRAIASEFDLSLFVFQFEDIDRDSELFTHICNYLSLQFQFKDLLFEYKNDCLVAIRNSMNLDEALNFSDKIFTEIKSIIENKKCFIGISTRSIRMVGGERLLLEAEEALKHARDDESTPVVAFRVDAEKYREYMEKNQN